MRGYIIIDNSPLPDNENINFKTTDNININGLKIIHS